MRMLRCVCDECETCTYVGRYGYIKKRKSRWSAAVIVDTSSTDCVALDDSAGKFSEENLFDSLCQLSRISC